MCGRWKRIYWFEIENENKYIIYIIIQQGKLLFYYYFFFRLFVCSNNNNNINNNNIIKHNHPREHTALQSQFISFTHMWLAGYIFKHMSRYDVKYDCIAFKS